MSDIAYLPSLGSSGVWSLAAPYTDLVVASGIYRCESIVLLAAAVNDGTDPLTNIYLAAGDTEERYNADLERGDYLVTISSTNGSKVTFPRSAMRGLPISDGVVYQTVFASISLSAMPANYDYIALENDLKSLVRNTVGVNSSVYFQATGEPLLLSYEQDTLLRTVRENFAVDPDSLQNRYDALKTAYDAREQLITKLEQFIATHIADINPP